MADQIIKLLNNAQARKNLARRAKQYVINQYDWKTISKKLDKVYQEFS
jgi:glycosyltransferase involved in cell wall biosynthesis